MKTSKRITYVLVGFVCILLMWYISFKFFTTKHCISILSEKVIERTLVGGTKINVYVLEVYDGEKTMSVKCNERTKSKLVIETSVLINNGDIVKVLGRCK